MCEASVQLYLVMNIYVVGGIIYPFFNRVFWFSCLLAFAQITSLCQSQFVGLLFVLSVCLSVRYLLVLFGIVMCRWAVISSVFIS